MEARQIKEQMTQGDWLAVINHNSYSIETGLVDIAITEDFDNEEEQEANAAAIVLAVNNTFGRDINPAQVPELYRMLDHVKRYLVGDILREVNELLAASKFTNEQNDKEGA